MTQSHDLWSLLDSRKLRTFVVLAKTGSFTQTGRDVGISQSGVSHCIRSLESDMGCRLFDRLGKKVHTTAAGEHLLHHANRILQEMAAARAAIERLGKWGQSRLRLGASPAACQYILPGIFVEFKRSYPQTMVSIESCNSARAMSVLEQGGVDLALSLRPEGPNSCQFEPLFQDELGLVLAPSHPWAKRASPPQESLATEPFVLYSKSSHTFKLIENYFRREDITLNVVAELGSMDAIKEFVRRGLGSSILAPWVVRRELEEGSLVMLPLGRRRLKRDWGLLWLQGRRLSLVEETFVQLCREGCSAFEGLRSGKEVAGG